MKNLLRKSMAVMLAALLVIGVLPVMASAEDTTTTITVGGQSVYDGTTWTTEITIPSGSYTQTYIPYVTATIVNGTSDWTASLAAPKTDTESGDVDSTLTSNTLKYYIELGGEEDQSVVVTFSNSDETIADVTVTVTFTDLNVTPTISNITPSDGYNSSNPLSSGDYVSFTLSSAVSNYSKMSDTQKALYDFEVTDVTDDYGAFRTSYSSTSSSTLIEETSYEGDDIIYYVADTGTGYDKLTFTVTPSYASAATGKYIKVYTETSGYDFDEYDEDDDLYIYVGTTYSSSSATYAKATKFEIEDFGDYFSDIDEDDYGDYYIQVVNTGDTGSDDIMQLGTLYYNGDEVDTDTEIYLDDIDSGKFRYIRTTDGVDEFTFTLYDDDNDYVTGVKKINMWIIDDNSLITGEYPLALDITVATSEDDSYTFDSDLFENAFISGDDLEQIKITSLPDSDLGTLYSSSTAVEVGDVITASKLSKLKFTPDDDEDNYDDGYFVAKFTYTAISEDDDSNYALDDGTVYIYCFEDEDDYDEAIISGNVTARSDGSDITFSENYFTSAFWSCEDDDEISYIYIVSLPSNGDLYLDGEAVAKKEEIPFEDIGSLTYEPDDDDDIDDDFDYYVISAAYEDDEDAYADPDDYSGTVTIAELSDEDTAAGSGTWTNLTGTSPVYTVSSLTPSSGTISYSVTSSLVTEILSKCKSGSTLTIVLSPKSGSTSTALSLTIDPSLYSTATNVAKIPYIVLSEGSGKASLKLSTSELYKLYAAGSKSSLTLTLTQNSIKVSNSLVSSSVSTARTVAMKIGSSDLKFTTAGAAVLSVPYASVSGYSSDMVVMYSYSGSSYNPMTSSQYSGSLVSASIEAGGQYFPAVNSVSFSDTSGNWAWTRGYISSLAARGTINGYNDGTYLPSNYVTRAEYIKLLIVSLGLEDSTATSSFTDVVGQWSYPYVSAAYKLGIISGGTNFNPNEYITRQDMALYSYRAAEAAGLTIASTGSTTTFKDQTQITGEYSTAIKAMQSAGIINGMAGEYEGYYLPLGNTDRAAAAKVIWFLNALYYGWSTSGKY